MQTRPNPKDDQDRVWLSRRECEQLVDVADEDPRKGIAVLLGLHGLRSDEIVNVCERDLRPLEGATEGASVAWMLAVPDGKTGKRELPVSTELSQKIRYLKAGASLRRDEPVVGVGTRQLRKWIAGLRRDLEDGEKAWSDVGWHDLRRTWATDAFYSLAVAGVPIAETLVMSWGGWKQNENGRTTFRESYLGPVPDHITASTAAELSLP